MCNLYILNRGSNTSNRLKLDNMFQLSTGCGAKRRRFKRRLVKNRYDILFYNTISKITNLIHFLTLLESLPVDFGVTATQRQPGNSLTHHRNISYPVDGYDTYWCFLCYGMSHTQIKFKWSFTDIVFKI